MPISAIEIGKIMMALGYAVTTLAIGRIILNAMVAFFYKVLQPIVSHLMERYAPRWLLLFDLRVQAWLTLPSWLFWFLDDMAVTALEGFVARKRATTNSYANQLLIEAEDYEARYFEFTNSK